MNFNILTFILENLTLARWEDINLFVKVRHRVKVSNKLAT